MRAKYLGDDDRRQPEEISRLLGSIIESSRVDVDIRQGDLVGEWASFAPGDWTRGTPVGVRDRTLLVTVPDGSVASLLQFQHRELITAIEERYGADLVTAVRVRVERSR
jgi:predicted nucleic acid-binding Zn ribbon protein